MCGSSGGRGRWLFKSGRDSADYLNGGGGIKPAMAELDTERTVVVEMLVPVSVGEADIEAETDQQ